jgi:hypothetical protein
MRTTLIIVLLFSTVGILLADWHVEGYVKVGPWANCGDVIYYNERTLTTYTFCISSNGYYTGYVPTGYYTIYAHHARNPNTGNWYRSYDEEIRTSYYIDSDEEIDINASYLHDSTRTCSCE